MQKSITLECWPDWTFSRTSTPSLLLLRFHIVRYNNVNWWWFISLVVFWCEKYDLASVQSFFWMCNLNTLTVHRFLSDIIIPQVADDSSLYGCCVYIEEIVQKPSGLISMLSEEQGTCFPLSRYIITTPRCYCILSRLPFFDLHFGILRRWHYIFLDQFAFLFFSSFSFPFVFNITLNG